MTVHRFTKNIPKMKNELLKLKKWEIITFRHFEKKFSFHTRFHLKLNLDVTDIRSPPPATEFFFENSPISDVKMFLFLFLPPTFHIDKEFIKSNEAKWRNFSEICVGDWKEENRKSNSSLLVNFKEGKRINKQKVIQGNWFIATSTRSWILISCPCLAHNKHERSWKVKETRMSRIEQNDLVSSQFNFHLNDAFIILNRRKLPKWVEWS